MLDYIKNSSNYRWYVLATVSLGTFMGTLDGSIVTVALPTISGDLHTDISTIQWILTAYLLTTASLLAVFGRVADMFGRKKIFSNGFLLFVIGSALCGLAPNIWILVGTRILQAVGASMVISSNFAILTSVFPPHERGKAFGLLGTVVALGSLTGPAVGGLMIGLTSWRAIFFINLPIGIIGYLAARLIIPVDEPRKGQETFDFTGALTFSAGVISVLLAVNNGPDWGWTSLPILAIFGLGFAMLFMFVITERRVQHPLIDFALFRNRPFLMGNLSGWLSFIALFANGMLLPFYLQQVLNYSPSQVGLLMTVFPVTMAFAAPLSGNASDKFGSIALTTSGLTILGLGLLYFAMLPASATFYQVIPGPILTGLGAGLFQSPNNSSVMSSVPPLKLGVAGGITSLVRTLGMVIGVALSAALFEALGGVSNPAPGQIAVFMSAYRSVMLVAMVITLVGAVISLNRRSYTIGESS